MSELIAAELTSTHLKSKLKEVFGYTSFRGNQEHVMNSILQGRNTFVIMPTGAGKSLCYQLPAVVSEGTAIVISPLIALMKNQVDQLNAFGINAQFLNSTLNKSEMNRVKKETLSGEVKLLYVAPESLTKDENISFLSNAKLSFVAIDEAHCISEWGHDFRPEYRRIRHIIDQLGKMPVIALTATATPKVQEDILKNLDIEDADIFKSSFNRENLYYEVKAKQNVNKQLIRFIKNHKGKSGIIYCLSRKKVEELAELLRVNDIRALPYHAGLDASIRENNQDAFINEQADVIVATIAFGMGIDKPDVRFVVHYDAPKSLEGYYQETGRAGRDGLEGNCIMFFSENDIIKLEKFNKDKAVTERENAKYLLEEMTAYAETGLCRRKFILSYFGEQYDDSACNGMCDNCRHPRERFEATDDALLAIKSSLDTDQRFGISHLIDVLTGEMNDYVESYAHDKLSIFGAGKDKDARYWNTIFRQLTVSGFFLKEIESYGVLKVTEKGNDFVLNPFDVRFIKDHDFLAEVIEEEKDETTVHAGGKSYDEELFELLKGLRKKIAKEKNLPPYVIFQDPSLEEMATTYPTSAEEMSQINGVGMGKVQKFGKPFIELISHYVSENDIMTAADVVVKTAINKSKLKIFIIQQIDRKVDLDDICAQKNVTMEELMQEMEHICYSGTKLNIDYYIDHILEEDRQEEIHDYFLTASTDHIGTAYKALQEEYTEEELRLMRIKFLSEYAN
jgi:ATP-dependent DNA helicase RecQ